jgi:TolB protein
MVVLVVVALVRPIKPALAGAFPGANGRIAFDRFPGSNEQIFVMNPDGSSRRRITNNQRVDAEPDWSPNANKIAFSSDRITPDNPDGLLEVFLMNPDGTSAQNLTQHTGNDGAPAYAPSGQRIAFWTDRAGGKGEIYSMNAVPGAPQRNLTNDPAHEDSALTWQPLP